MKICPNCQEEVEDQFDSCWKCNYSFPENQIIEIQKENNVMKICPNCQAEVEEQFDLCWNCNYSFTENQVIEIQKENAGEREISCLRCNTPMRHAGRSNFQEGFFSGLLSNWESFDLYVCPKCDKVEFFAPKAKSLFGLF